MSAKDNAGAISAALLQAAQSDLGVLQAFQTLAKTPTTTLAALLNAKTTAAANISNPDTLAQLQSLFGGYTQFLADLDTLVSKTNAAAGN